MSPDVTEDRAGRAGFESRGSVRSGQTQRTFLLGMCEVQEILDALAFVSKELATPLQILGIILYLHLFIYTQISVTVHI